jgi:hypothetical protein
MRNPRTNLAATHDCAFTLMVIPALSRIQIPPKNPQELHKETTRYTYLVYTYRYSLNHPSFRSLRTQPVHKSTRTLHTLPIARSQLKKSKAKESFREVHSFGLTSPGAFNAKFTLVSIHIHTYIHLDLIYQENKGE